MLWTIVRWHHPVQWCHWTNYWLSGIRGPVQWCHWTIYWLSGIRGPDLGAPNIGGLLASRPSYAGGNSNSLPSCQQDRAQEGEPFHLFAQLVLLLWNHNWRSRSQQIPPCHATLTAPLSSRCTLPPSWNPIFEIQILAQLAQRWAIFQAMRPSFHVAGFCILIVHSRIIAALQSARNCLLLLKNPNVICLPMLFFLLIECYFNAESKGNQNWEDREKKIKLLPVPRRWQELFALCQASKLTFVFLKKSILTTGIEGVNKITAGITIGYC